MSSVTFHAVCPPSNKRRDGTWPVKIRVTFKGRNRYLATTLVARQGDLSRSLSIKSPDITRRANELIARMQDTLRDLSPFDLEAMDVDGVVEHIRARMTEQSFALDFFAFGERYVAASKNAGTGRAYLSALGALERFLGRRELDINDISKAMLLDFVAFVDNEPKMYRNPRTGEWEKTDKKKKAGAASRHLMKLQHIFDAAKLKYNDEDTGRVLIPRSPFAAIPRDWGEPEGEEALPLEVMQRLILDTEPQGVERIAVDAFLLSFCTMGANLADLYAAPKFSGTEWRYCRKKITSRRAEMRVDIQPEAVPIVARLRGKGSGWWLGQLHRIAPRSEICTSKVNAGLRKWADRNGVEPFTFYAARKSWGTYARNLARIELATVDEALAHKSRYPLADVYIAKSWTHLNEANRKVLDLLRWDGGVSPKEVDKVNQPQDEAGVKG